MGNNEHLFVKRHERDIIEHLFPKHQLWKHWKEFGTFFKVPKKVLEKIESEGEGASNEECEEEFYKTVVYIMKNKNNFSKENIREALQLYHPESIDEFNKSVRQL